MFSGILRLLAPSEVVSWTGHPQLRNLLGFRFFYLFTAHAGVLAPFAVLLSGFDQSGRHGAAMPWYYGAATGLMSLGFASLVMALAETPAGLYADRFGPRRALRDGLLLMMISMLGFFALVCSYALAAPSFSRPWLPGIAGLFFLELLIGIALSLVNGADTVLFLRTVHRVLPGAVFESAYEGLGNAVRNYGTVVAVGLGALLYKAAEMLAERGAALILQGGVFLITFLAQGIALLFLSKIEDVPSSPTAHAPLGRKLAARAHSLQGAVASLLRAPTLLVHLWFYSSALAWSLFAVDLLRIPLSRLASSAVPPAASGFAFAVALMLGWWGTARASQFYRALGRSGRRSLHVLPSVAALAAALLPPILLFACSTLPSDMRALSDMHWAAFVSITFIILCFSGLRGFIEPLARTEMLRHADVFGVSAPTAFVSALTALQRLMHFGATLAFWIFALPGRRTGVTFAFLTQTALLYTGVGVLFAAMLGLGRYLRRKNARVPPKRVVVVGSFQRDFDGLMRFCDELRARGTEVLHPMAVAAIVGNDAGFVRLSTDASVDEGVIQRQVFLKIEQADALLVYAPNGYIGTSVALEIGYAVARGCPVFISSSPTDVTIRKLTKTMHEAGTDHGE